MEIWEPKPPGTLWVTTGLLRDSCNFYLLYRRLGGISGDYINFYGKGNENQQLGTNFLADHRTVSTVKTAEFVSDRMSCTFREVVVVVSF